MLNDQGQIIVTENGKLNICASVPVASGPAYVVFDARDTTTLRDGSGNQVTTSGGPVHTWDAKNQLSVATNIKLVAANGYDGIYTTTTPVGPGVHVPLVFVEDGVAPFNLSTMNSAIFLVVSGWELNKDTNTMLSKNGEAFFEIDITQWGWDANYNYDNSNAPYFGAQNGDGWGVSNPIGKNNNPKVFGFQWTNDGTTFVMKYINEASNGVQTYTIDAANLPDGFNFSAYITSDPLVNRMTVGSVDTYPESQQVSAFNGVFHEMRFYGSTLADSALASVYDSMKSSWQIS